MTSFTFSLLLPRGDESYVATPVEFEAKSTHPLAAEMVLDALDDAWKDKPFFADLDGTRGLTVWAAAARQTEALEDVVAAASALGVDAARAADARDARDAGDAEPEAPAAGLRARVAGRVARALRRQAATCRVVFEGRELVAFGVTEEFLARRDAAREARASLLGGADLPLVPCVAVSVDAAAWDADEPRRCRVAATADVVVLRPGRARLAALRRLGDGAAALEPGDALYGDSVVFKWPELSRPRRALGFGPGPGARAEAPLAAANRRRGYDRWRPASAADERAFLARAHGLDLPEGAGAATHATLDGAGEVPAPAALLAGATAAVAGAAAALGPRVLADELAPRLRKIPGVADVAVAPPPPPPPPPADAALALFRSLVAAAAPPDGGEPAADVSAPDGGEPAADDAADKRAAKEAKRERKRLIREEKEKRARKKAARAQKKEAATEA